MWRASRTGFISFAGGREESRQLLELNLAHLLQDSRAERLKDPSVHVIFNLMAHLPRLRTRPSGTALLNIRTNQVRILGQIDESRGFWHSNASPDGK